MKQPVFNKPQSGQSSNEYLDKLEELLRLNKGGRNLTLYDTGSNTPNILPEAAAIRPSSVTNGVNVGMQQSVPQRQQSPNMAQSQFNENVQNNGLSWDQFNQVIQGSPEVLGTATSRNRIPMTNQYGEEAEKAFPIRTNPDGTVGWSDGTRRDSEGFVVSSEWQITPEAYPIQSRADGSLLYSDYSIRYRPYGLMEKQFQGLQGLESALFPGQQPTITQEYGNYNPELEPGSGYNLGTDIVGKSGTQFRLPFDVEVVDRKEYDGTRWGDKSGHSGWGNSLLLRLPNGQMIRVSHMSQMAGYNVGDTIRANDVFGIQGDTGNTTGEHLDLELYDEQGRIQSPDQFALKVKENQTVNQYQTPASGQISQSQPSVLGAQARQSVQPKVQEQVGTPFNRAIEQVATEYKLPELGASELSAQQGTNIVRQAGGNVADVLGQKIGLPELGISERLAGGNTTTSGQPSGFQNLSKNVQRGVKEAGNIFNQGKQALSNVFGGIRANPSLIRTAQAAESKLPTVPTPNPTPELPKAGQGVQAIQGEIPGISDITTNKDLSKIGAKNAIGEETGNNQAGFIPELAKKGLSFNNQDPFFRSSGYEDFKGQLNPGITKDYRGALDIGLFKPSFYENPDNVANVFGSTAQGKEATDKYRGYMKTQYPILPGHDKPTMNYRQQFDGQWYDWEDVDPQYYENQYNQSVLDSIPSVLSSGFKYTTPRTGAKKQSGPTGIFEPVRGDKSIPTLKGFDAPNKAGSAQLASNVFKAPSNSFTAPSAKGFTPPSKSNKPSSSTGLVSSSGKSVPVPVPVKSQPVNIQKAVSSGGLVMSKPSPVVSKPAPAKSTPSKSTSKPNVFQQVVNAIKNIFR